MASYPRFKDKVVIVSGGADGMGRACSTQLAAEGARLFILDVKHDMAEELARGLSKSGARVEALRADVMNETELRDAIATVLRRTGGEVDSLINIAGGSASGLTAEIDLAVWDRLYALNLRSTLVACQAVIPAMRKRGEGSFFFSNNSSSLRGRKRMTGQSLYYPRVMMRTLAQVLTEEYSEHGVHVANVVIDGLIDSPGTHALPKARQNPDQVMNPVKIAEAFYYLHTQDRSVWTHELQLTPFSTKPSY